MAAAVLAIGLAALYVALFGRPAMQAKIGGKTAIWIGGVAFPMVVLTALLIYGLSLTRHLSDPIRGEELRVRVTGEMRSEEHTSELQSLMRNSYAVFCLKKKKTTDNHM